ncbi:hypothetical protein ACFYVK_40285 [Streptomyces chartreusis]|uniref:hypothetical protein n=1 Tax=Streptomyces chartreusis TaxID=1969 RepID=UPI00368190E1
MMVNVTGREGPQGTRSRNCARVRLARQIFGADAQPGGAEFNDRLGPMSSVQSSRGRLHGSLGLQQRDQLDGFLRKDRKTMAVAVEHR